LKITPPSGLRASNVAKPCKRAAADELTPAASTTSTIGAPSSRATCAVDAKSPRPDAPSNRPITPSMTATSAGTGVAAPWLNIGTIWSSPTSHGSRLRPGRPAASAW
jgi:hypothetical protein